MIENLDNEEWKDIAGYEGLYQVSSFGRVKSLWYGKERILKPETINKYGHQQVRLCMNAFKTSKTVHRLVAQAFIPNPENKPVIDHIDCNPRNNCVENLMWATVKENNNNPLSIIHNRDAKRDLFVKVYCYENSTTYQSVSEAARQLNVYQSGVSNCCNGKRKSTGGYHFCYASELKERLFK